MIKNQFAKTTIILRGYSFEQNDAIVSTLSNSSSDFNVEITLNTPNVFENIKRLKKKYPSVPIGAGTVLNFDQAQEAIKAGAEFILSPIMLDKTTLNLCKKNNVLAIPAGYSPTEIHSQFENGADIVKVFPASSLSSNFFKDIQAPLGSLSLMAVGGINVKNASEYIEKGCEYLGIGSGIFDSNDIKTINHKNLERSLNNFIDSVLG